MVERLLLAAALAAALPPQALADTFACRGRDPAWELLGQGDQAMLTRDRTPGHRLLTGKSATLQAEGVVVWRGRSTDGQPDVVVTMLKGACTDPGPATSAAISASSRPPTATRSSAAAASARNR